VNGTCRFVNRSSLKVGIEVIRQCTRSISYKCKRLVILESEHFRILRKNVANDHYTKENGLDEGLLTLASVSSS
jgi:hypothetical protein